MASSNSIYAKFQSEESKETDDRIEDDNEAGVSSSSCGCFFGFKSRLYRTNSIRYRYLLLKSQEGNEEVKENWMMKKMKKFKGVLKAMARRKWRSLIDGIISKRRSSVKFEYDPRSYALNFDDGIGKEGRFLDFRAQYMGESGCCINGV